MKRTSFLTGQPSLLAQALRPAVDRAVDRAMHDSDDVNNSIRFHSRLPNGECHLCPKEPTNG